MSKVYNIKNGYTLVVRGENNPKRYGMQMYTIIDKNGYDVVDKANFLAILRDYPHLFTKTQAQALKQEWGW